MQVLRLEQALLAPPPELMLEPPLPVLLQEPPQGPLPPGLPARARWGAQPPQEGQPQAFASLRAEAMRQACQALAELLEPRPTAVAQVPPIVPVVPQIALERQIAPAPAIEPEPPLFP